MPRWPNTRSSASIPVSISTSATLRAPGNAAALAQSRAELGFFAGLLRRFVAQEDDMQPLGAEHSGMNAIGWAEEQRPFSSVSHKPASGHDLLRWAEEDDETA